MASSEKRKVEGGAPAPKRRFKNPWENITEEERLRIMKQGDEAIARIDAIMAAEAALPPEVRRQNKINEQSTAIIAHIRRDPSARVTIQLSPWSPRGSMCRFELCEDTHIAKGSYRIAMKPGLASWHGSPDFFHVECFEDLADLASPGILSRVTPEWQTNIDCAWILDGGAEQAVWQWIDEQKQQHGGHSSAPSHLTHSATPYGDIPSLHSPLANVDNDPSSVTAPFAPRGNITAQPSNMPHSVVVAGNNNTTNTNDHHDGESNVRLSVAAGLSINSEEAHSIENINDSRGQEDNGESSVTAAVPAKEGAPAHASELPLSLEEAGSNDDIKENRGPQDHREGGGTNTVNEVTDRRHGLSQALNAWEARKATMTDDDPDEHLRYVTMRLQPRFF